ncbi:GntR family transcriptional regulator [Hypericibacter terrae]|jgi:DNA-binding FadR family transcriptional regulator|uniref:GntR family transcriptional regulator n=1 Tax=Hypericibacter terrae TaxID=2602015 RepID=A0A5J6MPB3_9PROT|nr:FCD domain-containing protein [Hypericibacter terrae]QEX19031.1 GntR family transcriptional regulator [Hypericibacter terrae]
MTTNGQSARLQTVTEELRSQIANGGWPAGRQVPPERALAEQFGLARNTLRRVLKLLEEEGLLERHVGRGTFVRSPNEGRSNGTNGHNGHNGHGAGLANGSMSGDLTTKLRGASPADLMEVRIIIEPQMAALAASRATAEDIAQIELALKHSIAAKGLAEFEHWDAQLHLTIFRAAKNAILLAWCEAINVVRNEPDWYRLKKRSVTPEVRNSYDRDHTEIVAALKERDPEAARKVLFKHLSRVRDSLLALG